MKIGFIIAYERSPYSGVVRPFVNWAKEIKNKYNDRLSVELILLGTGNQIIKNLDKLNLEYRLFKKKKELLDYVKNKKFNYILIDDYIKRLKLVKELKKFINQKFLVYVQVLYGTHSIISVDKPFHLKDKLLFFVAKLIPFPILRRRYTSLVKYADIVIANSNTTATLLHILYGIEPNTVIYPPVDTRTFKSYGIRKEDSIVLYLGSYAGDTDLEFIETICKVLDKEGYKIYTIGNKKIQEKISRKFNIIRTMDISDEDLAKIYSKGILTICPQKWEQFGYVVAESISCGTPVLAFNLMGPAEIISSTGYGFLANNKKEFLEILSNLESYLNYFNRGEFIQNRIDKCLWDINISTQALLKVLKVVR